MPVYLIRAGDTDMVKIGWADENVEARRAALQTAHWEELVVIRVIYGEPWIEHSMHHQFAEFYVRGEWFRFDPEMMDITPEELTRPSWAIGGAVSDIIDNLGGAISVSRQLKVPSTTVANWKGRNSIPARYHAAILAIGNGKLTALELIHAHAAPA